MPTLPALRTPGSRPPLRRLVLLVAVWIAVTGGALLVALALDSPVGEGARDEAQPVPPGAVAAQDPAEPGDSADPAVGTLPPFAMVLDRRLPADLAGLAPARQAEELRLRAMRTRSPERFVELGSVLQVLGDAASAEFSYRSALRFDPGNVAAQVGLAVVDGTSPEGLARASQRLRALARAHPREQLIAFNQGWVEIYRRRVEAAQAAFERTVSLGAETRLGRTAGALLTATEQIEMAPPAGP